MCYFIVLMSTLLFYNLENSKNKEKVGVSKVSVSKLLTGTLFPIFYLIFLHQQLSQSAYTVTRPTPEEPGTYRAPLLLPSLSPCVMSHPVPV